MSFLSRKLIVLLILFPVWADAQTILINEVAWMGTKEAWQDEWIELYNPNKFPVIIDQWTLSTADGQPNITLKGSIPPFSFYLLERTDDNAVPNIPADLIYKGGLGNQGEHLMLKNNNIIDEVDSSLGWLAGNNESKQTMERINDQWKNSNNIGGTPRAENSPILIIEKKEIPTINKESGFNTTLFQGSMLSIIVTGFAWLKIKKKKDKVDI
jgi:hypothetical protein